MNIALPDKVIAKILPEDYIIVTDEGEAIAMACGFYCATEKTANVYISADGFMNALNAITSLAIPESFPINLYISYGRQEKQHKIASDLVIELIEKLKQYDTNRISFTLIAKE